MATQTVPTSAVYRGGLCRVMASNTVLGLPSPGRAAGRQGFKAHRGVGAMIPFSGSVPLEVRGVFQTKPRISKELSGGELDHLLFCWMTPTG